MFTKKKDLITQKKGLLTYTKQTHGKKPQQIAAANSHGKYLRQIPTANSCGKFPQQIAAANSYRRGITFCYEALLEREGGSSDTVT